MNVKTFLTIVCLSQAAVSCSETQSFLKGAGNAVPGAAAAAARVAANDPTPVGLIEAMLTFVGKTAMGGVEAVQNNKAVSASVAAALAAGMVHRRKKKKKKAAEAKALAAALDEARLKESLKP